MPFEAMNVPATFQRLMDDRVLERSNSAPMFGIYVDDLLIFTKSFDKHLEHLENVFLCVYAKPASNLSRPNVVSKGITKWITKALTLLLRMIPVHLKERLKHLSS